MFNVHIQGLQFYGYHGVPEEERAVGHAYCVDVSLEVDGSADETDAIADTVDYAAVSRVVEQVIRGAQCHTVERLAALCAVLILERFPLVHEATVAVSKPCPPMPFVASSAGAEVTRARSP